MQVPRLRRRTKERLQADKRRGRVGGRPPALTPNQRVDAPRMRDEDEKSVLEIARLFRVSPATVRRA